MLVIMILVTGVFLYRDYRERPGIIEASTLRAVERTDDSITLQWEEARNTDTYVLYYKKFGKEYADWTKLELAPHVVEEDGDGSQRTDGGKASAEVSDLDEGTEYVFVVRADSTEREGFETKGKTFSTKGTQTIEVRDHMTKLTSSKPFKLDAKAETKLSYESSDPKVVSVNKSSGQVKVKGEGTATITIKAKETADYMPDETQMDIEVIASTPVSAGGASAYIIYNLSPDNCEAVEAIAGEGSIHVPQGVGYSGDKYYVAYGDAGSQRIISFDTEGSGRDVSVPSIDLGHPNGFCYAESTGLCYCVRGWTGRCVTYSPETGEYGLITLPYGASGIAYDRARKMLYTSSRTAMVAYTCDGSDDDYTVQNTVGVVSHSVSTYTQDCGGHAGIMMRCLSGSSKHGTNYIDLYDMINGNYLGSLACDLSEVESCIVDDEGYLEILANNTSKVDYIWKTRINIGDIAAGL